MWNKKTSKSETSKTTSLTRNKDIAKKAKLMAKVRKKVAKKNTPHYWERPKQQYESAQQAWMEGSKREFRKNMLAQFHLKNPPTKSEIRYNIKQEKWREEWVKSQIPLKRNFTDIQKSSEVYRPKKKFLLITCIVIIIVLAALLTISAFYDQQITDTLSSWRLPDINTSQYYCQTYQLPDGTYIDGNIIVAPIEGSMANHLGQVYSDSIFAEVIELIGVAPTTLITIFALGIIFWNSFRLKTKAGRAAVQTLTIALTFFWFWFTGFFTYFPQFIISCVGLEKYAPYGPTKNTGTCLIFIFTAFIIGGILGFAIFAALKFVKFEIMCELLRWAMIVSAAALAAIVVMEVLLKPVFCRERWRFIYAFNQVDHLILVDQYGNPVPGQMYIGPEAVMKYNLDTFGGFRDWYNLPIADSPYVGGNTPFLSEDITKSFPSGHMTMASCGILSLLILPHTVRACNTKKWKQTIWSLVPILLVIFGSGRLIAGAHYLSDVTFGMIISGGFLFIFYMLNTWSTRWLDKACGLQIYPFTKHEIVSLKKKAAKAEQAKAQQIQAQTPAQ